MITVEFFQSAFYMGACMAFGAIAFIYAKVYFLLRYEVRMFKNNFNQLCDTCKSRAIL